MLNPFKRLVELLSVTIFDIANTHLHEKLNNNIPKNQTMNTKSQYRQHEDMEYLGKVLSIFVKFLKIICLALEPRLQAGGLHSFRKPIKQTNLLENLGKFLLKN